MVRIASLRRLSTAWLSGMWLAASLLGSSAEAAPVRGAISLEQAATSLRPGEFAWDETAMTGAPPAIVISIALQRLYVYQGNALVGVSTVSTGRPGKETPLGDFQILQKARWHRSNLYSNAPMPFMQRLTWDGIALHAGVNPGYPASHGCIRLPAAFARALFDMTSLGATVSVLEYPLDPPVYLRIEGLEWAFADDMVTGGREIAMIDASWKTRPAWSDVGQGRQKPVRLAYAAAVFTYE